MSSIQLSEEQQHAFELLQSGENVFLTGAAGTGKSTVVRAFVRTVDSKLFPVLASTGAAAVLVGGRTFHSFFGLGIMEGSRDSIIDRALKNKRVVRRLQKLDGIIIDEISMLGGETLCVAEEIARRAREAQLLPWGGLRIIAVGDFAQLPPINKNLPYKPWAFLDPVWHRTGFLNCVLKEIHRSQHAEFLMVLNAVREGEVNDSVKTFLEDRINEMTEDFSATRLFPRRNQTDQFNRMKLSHIDSEMREFPSEYVGKARDIDRLKKQSPIPEVIQLKLGALVMLRQNDPKQRWVNGSLAHVEEFLDDKILLRLLQNDRIITLEKSSFSQLNADGEVVAAVVNYPLTLAYAATIHKAQGLTLDRAVVDVSSLWEPGQAYVALSRVTHPEGLFIEKWDARSIIADPEVSQFYHSLM